MGQHPSSEAVMLKSELSRLYQRKLVVDELIRSLERYAAGAGEIRLPSMSAGKIDRSVSIRRIA